MAYEDEIAEANKRSKRKDRFRARAEVNRKYGKPTEKRKRGGLAGTWDRNKQVISPALQVGLGLIPGVGPGLAAAAGGLIGGLDREGQSGIGFDAGGAAGGALKGYGLGKLGSLAGGKLGIGATGAAPPPPVPAPVGQLASANPAEANSLVANMLGAGGTAPTTGLPLLPAPGPSNVAAGAFTPGSITPPISAAVPGLSASPAGAALQRGFLGKVGDVAKDIGGFAQRNPEAVGGAFQGAAGMMQAGANNRLARAQSEAERNRLAFEMKQYQDEQEQKRRRQEIAVQLFRQMQGQMSFNRPAQGMSP